MSLTRVWDRQVATGTTTGAVTLDLFTFTPVAGSTYVVTVYVLARSTSSDDRAVWYKSAFVNVTGGGAITIDAVADIIPAFSTNALNQADAYGVISGADLILRVLGDASVTSLEWQAAFDIVRS